MCEESETEKIEPKVPASTRGGPSYTFKGPLRKYPVPTPCIIRQTLARAATPTPLRYALRLLETQLPLDGLALRILLLASPGVSPQHSPLQGSLPTVVARREPLESLRFSLP